MVCTLVNPHTLFSTNLGKQINTSIISEDNCIKTNTEWEEIANEKESASEKMKAAAFINCFDMKKYGQLTADLEKAYTRGKDEYPNDLVEAFNILSWYKRQVFVKQNESPPLPTTLWLSLSRMEIPM